MSNPMAMPLILIGSMSDNSAEEERRPTIDSFITHDGKNFIARPHVTSSQALPAGVYAYDLQQCGMVYTQQEMPGDRVATLDVEQMAVITEVDLFWKAADFYKARGFTHKRGMVLYGPPGTGKTTTVRVIIADTVRRGGIVLRMRNLGELPRALLDIRALMPTVPVMVVAEEIDRWCDGGGHEGALLELLDGLVPLDHTLIVATTNHLCRIPARLKDRPSRIDRCIPVGFPADESRRNFITAALGDIAKPGEVEALVEKTAGMSISHAKEVVLRDHVYGAAGIDVLNEFRKVCTLPIEGVARDAPDSLSK